jgi:hypothetical protein
MARIDWYLEGVSFGSCNCNYSCPCQFEERPSNGDCQGLGAVRIDKGHFGETQLNGLCAVNLYAWPGPIFEGGGEMQVIIDERADAAQRAALSKILHGEETDEAATHWWVFRTMCAKVHSPVFAPIEFEVDVEARRARLSVQGLVESTGRPILSPATGQEHRIRIDLPKGIEFDIAEIGSSTTRATGPIVLGLNDSYGQFTHLRQSGKGVVRNR